MGLLDRFKGKESRFVTWLKAEYHVAALPLETRGEEVLEPFLGRLSGERLLVKLEPEHVDALIGLGLDDRQADPPVLAHLFRQDLADLRQANMEATSASPLPPGWVLDSEGDSTLGVLVVAPKALRKLLESCSQRIRNLSFHAQGLSATVHLHREEPQRLSQDLVQLLALLHFQRDPKEEISEPGPEVAAEAPPAPEPAVGAEAQLDLLGEPTAAAAEGAAAAAASADHPMKVHVHVQANGPLVIDGPIDVEKPDGTHLQMGEDHPPLCRCGKSGNKPFCDGTHKKIGFLAK